MTKTPNLDDDWRALGHVTRKRPVAPEPDLPAIVAVRTWLATIGTPDHTVIVVPGGSPQIRGGFYRDLGMTFEGLDRGDTRAWLLRGPFSDWVDRLRRTPVLSEHVGPIPGAHVTSWRWLLALAQVEDFVIDEPLRSMVDVPYYLVHDALRIFMGLRFLVLEGAPHERVVAMLDLLVRWATATEPGSQADRRILDEVGVWRTADSITERIDVLILLLTLAEQNGVLGKLAFVFDDLEAACRNEGRPHLRELHHLMTATTRWARFVEIPVGLILGFDPRQAPLLRRTNPKLASDVLAAMTHDSV